MKLMLVVAEELADRGVGFREDVEWIIEPGERSVTHDRTPLLCKTRRQVGYPPRLQQTFLVPPCPPCQDRGRHPTAQGPAVLSHCVPSHVAAPAKPCAYPL